MAFLTFFTESLDQNCSIDPFSTQYWEPAPKPKAATSKSTAAKNAMPPPAAPSNAFEALGTKSSATTTAASSTGPSEAEKTAKPQAQITKPELLPAFKKAVIANQKLSKMAIVEVLSVQIDGLTKAEAKVMLDHVAERRGAGRTKVWELKDGQ